METIGNLWLIWLVGVLGTLFYFLWLSWGFFAFLSKKEAAPDPEDKALTSLTLRTFWPLILTCLFLVLLFLAGFYHLVMV